MAGTVAADRRGPNPLQSDDGPLRVLLIADDDAEAQRFAAALLEGAQQRFALDRVSVLVQGLRCVGRGEADVVVLDLELPDSFGHDTFVEARSRMTSVPVVVLVAADQEHRAAEWVARGAEDCLVKGETGSAELRRSLTFAVQRHRIRAALQENLHRQQYTYEALRDSETRFRSIAESAVDAIVVGDERGRIVTWNRAAQVMFGYREADIVGRTLGFVLRPARVAGAEELDLGQPIPVGSVVEALGVRGDGSEFPVEVALATWEGPLGHFCGAIIRDVTDRKLAEAATAREMRRLSGVVQAQHDITAAGLDVDDVLAVALRHAMTLAGAAGAAIALLTEGVLRYRGGCGALEAVSRADDVRVLTRRAVLTATQARGRGGHAAAADAAAMAVPLLSGGRVVGALEVVGSPGRPFEDADAATATLLAGFIGAALDQVDAFAARTNLLADRTVALQTLAESEQRFRQVFRDAPVGILLASLRPGEVGRVLKVNEAMCRIVGLTAAAISRLGITALVHPDDRAGDAAARVGGAVPTRALAQRLVAAGGAVRYVEGSVSVIRDAAGVPLYSITQVEDVTARKEAEGSLRRLALHDTLTGLPNRALVVDRLDHALRRARRRGTRVGLLFCDLDHFKSVNDRNGHLFGDQALIGVGQRLQTLLRPNDTAARLGGDEFILVCEDLDSDEEAVAVAERIAAVMAEPLLIDDVKVVLTASIGICVATGDEAVDELLRRADTAMYSAKRQGRAGHAVFNRDVGQLGSQRKVLAVELRQALTAGELSVVYQPVYDVMLNDVVGVEALVRWHHPRLGMLLPAAFLDVADDSGLMVELGEHVRAEACRQAAAWQTLRPDGEPLALWVNVSRAEVADPAFGDTVDTLLDTAGLDPTLLRIDIAEDVLVTSTETALRGLCRLRERGVGLGLDDFGCGETSIRHLSSLPITYVKVDRSFVHDAGPGFTGAAFVSALAGLGQSLHLDVVAEGVETPRELDWIGALGYRLAQGHYLGRPCTPLELEEVVRRSSG